MGARHVRGKGMPVYALLSASAEELGRHMARGRETVMEPFGLRKACICIQWPFPRGDGYAHVSVEECIHVDPTMTKVHLAMNVAKVFNRFYEKHRVSLGVLPEYAWLLRPDAMFRVWLTALEHTENDVFVAEFKYAKDYPDHDAA
ncbi:hypothetical protein BD413DRAFT_590084 [Trametes elegans]|nr:hypothetical protein BD413DRAFT_590084 [Trametes elegans]